LHIEVVLKDNKNIKEWMENKCSHVSIIVHVSMLDTHCLP
jgi:hypothetical protein